MAFDLSSISTKAVNKPPMMLLVAKEKMGKSSFCAGDRVENGEIVEWGINKPIILWLKGEQGVNGIPVAKNTDAIDSYEGLLDALNWLCSADHEFETVTIDSLTTLCEIVKEKVQRENPDLRTDLQYNRMGEGDKVSKPLHRAICEALTWLRDNKNMTVIFTAHIKPSPKMVTDPEKGVYDAWQPDIPNSVWSLYSRSFDLILYADTKDVVTQQDAGMGKTKGKIVSIGNGERFLFTKKTSAHPSGGRGIYGHLPPEIPFSWSAFQDAIAETISRINNK